MSDSAITALRNYVQGMAELSKLDVTGASEREALLRRLLDLISVTPFSSLPELSVSPVAIENRDSLELQPLLCAAAGAFAIRNSKEDAEEALKTFIWGIRAPRNRLLPEAQLLIRAANRWLDALRVEDENTLLSLEIGASLDLSQREEYRCSDGTAKLALSIFIANQGFPTPAEAYVCIETSVNVSDCLVSEAISPHPRFWKKALQEIPARGARVRDTIMVSYRGYGSVKVWIEYSSSQKRGSTSLTEVIETELISSTQAADESLIRDISNPYIPDLPLLTFSQWERLAKGTHRQLSEHLLEDLSIDSGRVVVIRGCRRTGKTSILQHLRTELEHQGDFLPVYIDLYMWFLELKNRDKCVKDGETLYYELVRATFSAIESTFADIENDVAEEDPRIERLRRRLDEPSKTRSLQLREFEDFMSAVKDELGRRVLLIIDELDWLVNMDVFAGTAESMLGGLAATSLRRGSFSALLSHDWTSPGWEPRYKEGRWSFLTRRVRFLRRSDVEALARVDERLRVSDMAIDFIWRFTGGWPGLVQLLCYEVIEVVRRGENGSTIDIVVAKAAARRILDSPDYGKFLSYLLGGLLEDEMEILSWLLTSNLIDLESGEILGLHRDPASGYRLNFPRSLTTNQRLDESRFSAILLQLEEKEIIAELNRGSGRTRLLVGLMAYRLTYTKPPWRYTQVDERTSSDRQSSGIQNNESIT